MGTLERCTDTAADDEARRHRGAISSGFPRGDHTAVLRRALQILGRPSAASAVADLRAVLELVAGRLLVLWRGLMRALLLRARG